MAFNDPKIQDIVNKTLSDLQELDNTVEETKSNVDSFQAKENIYDIWGQGIDIEEITRRLIKKYAGQDGYAAITTNPEDNSATSTTRDQSNQPPMRTVSRTPSGYILSDQDKESQFPLQIELKNQKFDVETFDKKIDVIIRELVPADISRLSDRVTTELMTLEEQLAALQGQLSDRDTELDNLRNRLDDILGEDGQVYPDGTILTIPEKTWTYIVYKGKRRYIPDVYVQNNSYTAAETGYPIDITQPVQGRSLLDTILSAYQGSVRSVNMAELKLMDEGYVTKYIVNPARDTVTIEIPDQPQPYTVNLGLSYDEDGNVELDEDGYPIEQTKIEMGPGDPVKIGDTPPKQTITISTQMGAAAAAAEQEANDADTATSLQIEIAQLETRMGELDARIVQAVDDTNLNNTNKGIWKAYVNNGDYQTYLNKKATNAFKRIAKKYRNAGYGPDTEDSLQEACEINRDNKALLLQKQNQLAQLQ